MTTASFVRRLDDFRGDARLYKLSEPISYGQAETDHIVASAVTVLGRPETYLFPADAQGEILDWLELPGSLKDTLRHEEALAAAGYEVTP